MGRLKNTGVVLVLLLVFPAIGLTGCWNRTEVDELAIILGAAVDKAPAAGQVMLTAEIGNPPQLVSPVVGGGGGDAPVSWMITSTGWSVFEAVRNLTQQTRSKSFWGHSQAIVIGEELAREGVVPVLDLFIRDHEMRRVAWVVIAKGATGKELLSVEHQISGATGQVINDLVRVSTVTSNAVQINITDFLTDLIESERGAVAGRLELVNPGRPEGILAPGELGDQSGVGGEGETGSGGGGGNGTSGGGAGGSSGQQAKPETLDLKQNLTEGELLRYTGAAIFKGDRLVGWLDRKQARGYNWVMGQVASGIIVVSSPEQDKPKISIEITDSAGKISTKFAGGKPAVKVEIRVDGNIGEHMGNRDVTRDQGLLSQLEARMAQVVRNEIEAALAIAQEQKTDIFCFGKVFNRQYHQEWQQIKADWQDRYFPELAVEIVVDANIRRTGMTNRPVIPDHQ